MRQSCLAHLSRAAKKLSQDPVAEIAKGGLRLYKELCRLTKIDRETLTEGEWRALMMRVKGLINLFKKRDDCLGTLARRLEKDGVSLYTFLRIAGVEATNNIAERALRAIVVKRKSALGSISEAGFRWLERSFSFKQTCRGNKSGPILRCCGDVSATICRDFLKTSPYTSRSCRLLNRCARSWGLMSMFKAHPRQTAQKTLNTKMVKLRDPVTEYKFAGPRLNCYFFKQLLYYL